MSAPAKVPAAIVGPGNIGTDLLAKLRAQHADRGRATWSASSSPTGSTARPAPGVAASAEGVDWLLRQDPLPQIVFEATSAKAHVANAPRYAEAGIQAVDLTPAHLGPMVCPPVNLHEHLDAPNVNMITCGGQATIPIVHAVSRVDAGAVRGDRRLGRLAQRRARAPAPTSTSSPRPPPAPSSEVGGAAARQGDHHPEPGRAADDHAGHRVLR